MTFLEWCLRLDSLLLCAHHTTTRLNCNQANFAIPPCQDLEQWDVLSVVNTVANQHTGCRVTGYTFEYDIRQSIYRHTLDLCAP